MEETDHLTHLEYLDKLKRDDPMTYYEMTSDPTNCSGDDYTFIPIIAVGIIFFIVFLFLN